MMMGLEWIPYVCFIIGSYMASKGNPQGWMINTLGSIIFMLIGIYFGLWGIAFGNAIFTVSYIINYNTQSRKKNATPISK